MSKRDTPKKKYARLTSNPRLAPKGVNRKAKPKKVKDTDEQPKPKKSWNSQPVFPAVIADLQEREKLGIKKYGQALHTENGRDALKDAYQESLDQTLYLKQRLMEEAASGMLPIDPVDTPLLHDWQTEQAQLKKESDLAEEMWNGSVEETYRPGHHFPDPIAPPSPVSACDYIAHPPTEKRGWSVIRWWDDLVNGDPETKAETVLEEAQRLVNGDRGANYGHPFDDFGRTAAMVTGLLGKRLVAPLTPEDIAKIMICVKLSRECNKPARDNRTDIAGYVECLDKVVEERKRREMW